MVKRNFILSLLVLFLLASYSASNDKSKAENGINGPNESVAGDLCVFHANVPKVPVWIGIYIHAP